MTNKAQFISDPVIFKDGFIYTHAKNELPTGVWQDEIDECLYDDEFSGYKCAIIRNQLGSLCGYIGLSEGHPYFNTNRYDIDDIEVHGGLTFSDSGLHISTNPEGFWWLGFDCNHPQDYSPMIKSYNLSQPESYRTVEYVKTQIKKLARQLYNVANTKLIE